jgi:hypothetical protein
MIVWISVCNAAEFCPAVTVEFAVLELELVVGPALAVDAAFSAISAARSWLLLAGWQQQLPTRLTGPRSLTI